MSYDTWKSATPPECEQAEHDDEPSEPEPYKLAPKGASYVGGCFRKYLGEFGTLTQFIGREEMLKAFGEPNGDFYDSDNGYNGDEWLFEGQGERFNVYSRWGVFRIGANCCDEAIDDFHTWVMQKLGYTPVPRVDF